MYILLFSNNRRKAEYFSLKMDTAGHSTSVADTLASVHHSLRYSDPDFVIVDSDTFPEPHNDYKSIISICKRKFHLFYDRELQDSLSANQPFFTDSERICLFQIREVLKDIQIHKTLISETFSASTSEERLFLKQNRLPPSLALLLSYMLRHRDTDISLTTLQKVLWKDGTTGHQQTLYAYMNQLRKMLENRNCPIIIQKRNKGSYCLSIKKAVPNKETAL